MTLSRDDSDDRERRQIAYVVHVFELGQSLAAVAGRSSLAIIQVIVCLAPQANALLQPPTLPPPVAGEKETMYTRRDEAQTEESLVVNATAASKMKKLVIKRLSKSASFEFILVTSLATYSKSTSRIRQLTMKVAQQRSQKRDDFLLSTCAPASVQQVLSVAFEAQLKANTSTLREGSDSTLLDDNTTSVSTGVREQRQAQRNRI
ncbi:hypothetical protein BU15DRAFT_68000 [Melanogaster broomeanus]|nr:hypothetical protein BU15DRAFT_68000 [Melanogaster broomeanus]